MSETKVTINGETDGGGAWTASGAKEVRGTIIYEAA